MDRNNPTREELDAIHPNMHKVYAAFVAGDLDAVRLTEIVNRVDRMTTEERFEAQRLMRSFGVEPSELNKGAQE